MKRSKFLSLSAGVCCLFAAAQRAHGVITGLAAVPVSFEQGWLDATGAPISTGVSTTSATQDATMHERVMKAWQATNNRYCTVRLYITTDNATTPVYGPSGDDVQGIDFVMETRRAKTFQPGRGFFNYAPGVHQDSAGPQQFTIVNINQGQRAFDSYLTIDGADRDSDAGDPIEGNPDQHAFDALRGVSHVLSELANGQTGGLGGAKRIDCQNCGYFSVPPVLPVNFSYDTDTSLASNGGAPITGRGVLIGQFTMHRSDRLYGNALLFSNGPGVQYGVFGAGCAVPAPGAAALFTLAALGAGRRRRRMSPHEQRRERNPS